MDLKLGGAVATAEERAAIAAVLGEPETGWDGGERGATDRHVARTGHATRDGRSRLLPVLHAVNDRVGWISPGAIDHIAARLDVAPAEIYGVATFYGLFSLRERTGRQVHVCVDLACQMAGATVPAGAHESPCLGVCERAPAALVIAPGDPCRHAVIAPATPSAVERAVAGEWPEPEAAVEAAIPQAGDPGLVLLGRVGVAPTLTSYLAGGGYRALRRAIELGPGGVIREVLDSGLVGRGGAAFPAGRKWDAVARQPARPHYLVCNADESEPGTFKDRVLLEGDPFAVIESMTIAAHATGCERGFIYLRGEYPRATEVLLRALDEARARGLLGADVSGAGFDFDIELFRGAGAYICGEETAIFNSIEGYRGEPRNKPPYPVESGLFSKPTVVNNVETLVNVIPILLGGGPAFASVGTRESTGTKLFCVSGSVRRPGVYEVTFGVTLGELIELAGGLPPGRRLVAVLLGGAAGMFVGADQLDLPLTFEATRAAGVTIGSGVIIVLDEEVDLVRFVRRIAAFFRDESCGQCVPCRVGTVRQDEALERLAREVTRGDLDLLADVGRVMKDASICGLGQTAYNAVESAIVRLRVFP